MRLLGVLAALVVATSAAAAPARLTGAPASPFYAWTAKVPAPGALLRSEPLPAALALDNAAKSLRILYSSTDGIDGKTPIAVSGALYMPKGAPPAGGWPVVAWAHGTVGAAAVCAPSFRGRSERDIEISQFLAGGRLRRRRRRLPGPRPGRRPSLSGDAARGLWRARRRARRARPA